MRSAFFAVVVGTLVGCASVPKDRLPASNSATALPACGSYDYTFFNSRRLLALNFIIDAQIKRLELRSSSTQTSAQIEKLRSIRARTTFPQVAAVYDPALVTAVLKAESPKVMVSLIADSSGDKKLQENLTYLTETFIPNLDSHDYWCDGATQNSNYNGSQSHSIK